MSKTRDVKGILLAGLLIRLLGVGLMIKSRGANGSTALLVMCQVLQGMGGGFAATAIQTGAQAVVSHAGQSFFRLLHSKGQNSDADCSIIPPLSCK